MKWTFIFVLFLALSALGDGQQKVAQRRHWEETQTETLWRGRYSNCDYGYYVLLPAGMVGHAEHPPNPNHGFLIRLPDVGSAAEVSVYNSERFIWVLAEYNVSEASSLKGVADYYINLTSREKRAFKLTERHEVSLTTLAATRFKVEYEGPEGKILEEEVVALRSGIVYELGIKTPVSNYAKDTKLFEEVLGGFRLSRLPRGGMLE